MPNPSKVYRGLLALLVLALAGMDKAQPPQTEPAEIQRLIRQLGSDQFAQREAASRKLAAIGEPAEKALREALHDTDLEVRRRAAELVEALVDKHRQREMAALQGCWVLKTAEAQGEKANQDPVDDDLERLFARQTTPAEERELVEDASQYRTTLTFKGASFELRRWARRMTHGPGGPEATKGTYSLDVERKAKVMRRHWQDDGNLAEIHVLYSLYCVEGDTLRICAHLLRSDDPGCIPTQFATLDEANVVLLTFRREKQ